MLENCKTCLFYNPIYDEMCGFYFDEDTPNDTNPDKHFCGRWRETEEIIPKEVWENNVKCKHYIKK